MLRRLTTTSLLTALAVLALPTTALADTLASARINGVSVDADGTTTQRVLIHTSGTDIPNSVALTLTPKTDDGGAAVEVGMDEPHSGTVLTSGALDLLIEPKGGTATVKIQGLGGGVAVGNEFEVVLPLHPDDGGEADVKFDGGTGLLTATTTLIDGKTDAYSVTLSLDFEINGDVDVTALESFDVRVQTTEGAVTVIDDQAELLVDGSDLRWRDTIAVARTDEAIVRYDGVITTTTGDITSTVSEFSTYRPDLNEGETATTTVLTSTLHTRERADGTRRLILKQYVYVVGDMPLASTELSLDDGTAIATMEPTVNRSTGLFAIDGLEYADSVVGEQITLTVDMLSEDGESLGSDAVVTNVRESGSLKSDTYAKGDDVYVWAAAAVERDDGTVRLVVAIGGDAAADVTDISVEITGEGTELTSEPTQAAARKAQVVQLRDAVTVDGDLDGSTVSIDALLMTDDGETVDTILGKYKPGSRLPTSFRRAMKTELGRVNPVP